MSIKIIFRKDRKKWQVTHWLNGKRKRPLFDKELEARNFARRMRRGESDEQSITIASANKLYFETVSVNKSQTSKENDRRYLNLLYHFLTVERGLENISEIELPDLEALQSWLLSGAEFGGEKVRMSASTVNRAFHTYKHFFRKLVQWGKRKDSPAIYLDNLAAEEKPRRAMTQDEFLTLIPAAPSWLKASLGFMHLTGAPPSCIERLTWDDIKFAERKIIWKRRKGRGSQLRQIPVPMSDEAFSLLLAQRNKGLSDKFVFENESGTALSAEWFSRAANRLIKTCGLKGVTVYSIRHALASDLTQANVATELVRQIMGHANISTTQRYAKSVGGEVLTLAIQRVRGDLVAPNCHQKSKDVASGGTEKTSQGVK